MKTQRDSACSLQGKKHLEGYAPWLQFSLSPDGSVVNSRNNGAHASARLAIANGFFRIGEKKVAKRLFRDALNDFYNAISLFIWLKNLKVVKKQSTPREEDICPCSFDGEGEVERLRIIALKANCFTLIALCCVENSLFHAAILASKEALVLDPRRTIVHQYMHQAVMLDPRAAPCQIELANQELRRAAREYAQDSTLFQYYLMQRRLRKSKELAGDRIGKLQCLKSVVSNPLLTVVGASSSGCGGEVKMSFQDAITFANQTQDAVEALMQVGKVSEANLMREKVAGIMLALQAQIKDMISVDRKVVHALRDNFFFSFSFYLANEPPHRGNRMLKVSGCGRTDVARY